MNETTVTVERKKLTALAASVGELLAHNVRFNSQDPGEEDEHLVLTATQGAQLVVWLADPQALGARNRADEAAEVLANQQLSEWASDEDKATAAELVEQLSKLGVHPANNAS